MQEPQRIPVIIGVGQLRSNRERTVAGAREPAELMLEALERAAADAGAPQLLAQVDSIDAINVVSWSYDDLPGLLAARLGARPRHRFYSAVGGHQPARLLDDAAARIARGESRIAVVVGAEAQASTGVLAKAGIDPVADCGWSAQPGGPPGFAPELLGSERAQTAGLLFPTRVYPLFENRLRYELGQTPTEANEWSAQLYAELSRAAAHNPAAWNPTPRTAEEIGTPGGSNRMVCEPYPLSMNAMPHVDQGAAVIVTSLATARELGVPAPVYVWGGAGADEAASFLDRDGFGSSPAMASCFSRTLDAAGMAAAELSIVDVYTCFPVVPKFVSLALGLPRDTPLSVTGGHSAFGGPMNTYTLFSVVAVTQRLREAGGTGLVHGNGGFVSYQHAVVLGAQPHPDGYVGQPEPVMMTPTAAPTLVSATEGTVTVETATVEYDRNDAPATGFLVARTANGQRIAAQTAPGDTASATELSVVHGEIIGKPVHLTLDGTCVQIAQPG